MPYMLPLLNMQAAPPQHTAAHGSQPAAQQMMLRTVSISVLVMSLPLLYVSFLHVPPAALFGDTTFWFLMSNSIIIVIAADSGMLFGSSSLVDVDSDGDGGLLPFVVAGGEPAAFKNGHVVDEVMAPVEENQVVVLREELQEDVTTTVAVENHHAYALVLQGGEQSDPVPEGRDRDIMIVTPPPSSDLAGAMVRATTPPGLSLTSSSRSLAREQRPRRRHSHRQPSSHSCALVPVQDKSVVVVADEEQESEYSRLSDEELNRRVEEFIANFNMETRLQLEREQLALAAA
jgi:hypothetical protein